MTTTYKTKGRVVQTLEKLGHCLELVSMDPNFKNITVGLYAKDQLLTVWTFSNYDGVDERIKEIRDQVVKLGGLVEVQGTNNQVKPSCSMVHAKALKFLMRTAVEKLPDFTYGEGRLEITDLRSPMTMIATPREENGRWFYDVTYEGEYKNPGVRARAVVQGFLRYGEAEKVDDYTITFLCGARHDELVRLLLPYARNVSGTQEMMDAESSRGQMTTSTLGFAQT